MNVMLSKNLAIESLVISKRYPDPRIVPYHVTVDMNTNVADNHDLNCAFARIKHWSYVIMQEAVLISQDHPARDTWQNIHSRCLVFPEDPVDQLVGIMLWRKFTAIVENRLVITRVSISSPLDEGMIYHHEDSEAQGCFWSDGWWSDPRPIWNQENIKGRGRGKVINLHRTPEWKDHDLDWDEDEDEDPPDQDVVTKITDFNRDGT
jgi:hypothetical protein